VYGTWVKDSREESKHLLDKPPELQVCCVQHDGCCSGERRPIGVFDGLKIMIVVIHVMEQNRSAGAAAKILCGECQRIGFTASQTSIHKRPLMNCTATQMGDAPIPWNMNRPLISET
jgi:hypothetical protein